jgi:hypothetical protein
MLLGAYMVILDRYGDASRTEGHQQGYISNGNTRSVCGSLNGFHFVMRAGSVGDEARHSSKERLGW